MAEEYKTLHPIKYYRHYLSLDTRPDGRKFDDFRPIIINVASIENADGSALVKIGNTTIVCGLKAELCKPKPEAPNKGFLVPNLELSPLCSSKFRSGPPSNQAQVLTQLIADIIENSGCVNLEDLCVFPDKLVWCLFVDFICLNFDGAIVDACITAFVGALKSTILPLVDYDSGLDKITVNSKQRIPINVLSTPISTTFVIFDQTILLADPTVEEENLCTGILTIVLKGDEICCVHKPGGSPLKEEDLLECIDKSKQRALLVTSLIDTALKDFQNKMY